MRIGGGFHEEQAWDSLQHEFDSGDWGYRDWTKGEFGPNPDYYHHWEDINGVVHETEKAYLIDWIGIELWVAKSLVRGFNEDRTQMFVHLPTFNKIRKQYIEAAHARQH